jgi:hypothetical protein
MIKGKLYILVSVIFGLAAGFSGCQKMDTLPQLEILVLDENNMAVSGASVALFESAEECNLRKNPVQVWRNTDASGRVLFVGLREIIYYFYVRYDGKDNSIDEVYTFEPLKINQRDKIVLHIR